MKQLYALLLILVLATCTTPGERSRMLQLLQEARQQNLSDVPFTSDSTMKEVVKFFDRHGDTKERVHAHYLLGRVYADLGDAPMALQCYQEALEKADTTTGNDTIYTLLNRIHSQMAELYYEEYMPDKSLQEMHIAEKYAWKAKDTLAALINYERQANVYDMMEKSDSAILIRKSGVNSFLKYGYEKQAYISIGALLQSFVYAERYDEISPYMEIYTKKSGLFDSNGDIKRGYELFYYAKGMHFLYLNKTDSAEHYIRKLQKSCHNLNDSLTTSGGYLQLYIKKHNLDSIAKYARLRLLLVDKAFDEETVRNMQHLGAVYNYAQQEKIAREKMAESDHYQRISFIVSICFLAFLLMALAAWVLVRNRMEKSRREAEAYKAEMEKAKQEHRKTQENLEKEKGELRNLTILKDSKDMEINNLKEQVERLAHEKQAEIDHLQQQLERQETENPYLIDDRLMASPVYARFKEAAQGARNLPIGKPDWEELFVLMNKNIPHFYRTLNPTDGFITITDYKICLLLRLHFTNIEICSLCGVESGRVSTTQKRLLKRVFGINGMPRDFTAQLMRIS